MEDEGHDRTTLDLPSPQRQLIDAVAGAAKGPVILVVMSGGCLDLAFAEKDDRIAAILFAGYPGEGSSGMMTWGKRW
jgi:xylan 1,4-beta-xylosidase